MRTVKGLSDADRLSIIHEHLAGASKGSLARKYNLHNGRIILKWMRIFGIVNTREAPIMKKENESQEILCLEKELKELKATLAYERMRADAYDTMISLAEKEFRIPIRKKSGTRQ